MNDKFKTYEDIYPLTIVRMRYGGKYVAFNCDSDNEICHDIQLGDEPSYNIEEYMDHVSFYGLYGVGDTIWQALDNLIEKQNE